jgi:hypothetical protein
LVWRLVDPDGSRERRRLGSLADEPFRVSLKSGVQHGLAMDQEIGGLAQMNHGGGHQAQARVVVFKVVPAEEGLAKTTGVFDGAEAVREARRYFKVRN